MSMHTSRSSIGAGARRPLVALMLCIAVSAVSCRGQQPQPQRDMQPTEPVITLEQSIETPMLPPTKTAKRPKPRAPKAPETKPAKPTPPKEIVPGMPLATPPLPPESSKEAETALTPTPPKSLPGTDAVPSTAAKPSASPEQVPFTPKLVAGATSTDVLIDASGSMNALFGTTGEIKFDLLRRAVEDVFLSISEQRQFVRNIGVRVFGAGKPHDAQDCKDTQDIVPLGPFDMGRIAKAMSEITPQGMSPLTYALEQASHDFPDTLTGDRVIVIIADGADTCGQNPCAAATALQRRGFIVQVIGFDVLAEDEQQLRCTASNAGGNFYLARTEAELRKAIDEALSANVPYNLRLTITAGGMPLPATVTVLQSGTSTVVSKERSFGSKIFKLNPGSYDILIEYTDSPETTKPSKLIKGVDILGTTKVEQTVTFDLGQLSLTSLDNTNRPVPASYRIFKSGTTRPVAEVQSEDKEITLSLSPGTYDITANQIGEVSERLILTEKGVSIATGQSASRIFRFQKGRLVMRGQTTQNKRLPMVYQVYPTGKTDMIIASGAVPEGGGAISLSPGVYDMIATGQDPLLPADPRTKVTNISIEAAQPTDLVVTFEMGELDLSAVDDKDKPIGAEFRIEDAETDTEIARVRSTAAEPAKTPLPPGRYRVTAYSLRGNVEPKPSVVLDDVQVAAKEPVAKTAKFVLGTIRVRGMNAKEEPIKTQFTLYRSGTEEIVAVSKPTDQWVLFDVSPGSYDLMAVDMTATSTEKPHVRINDLKSQAGQTISHQSIFTAGKIKIIGRGPNNKIITVAFKIFEYGADRELISGKTGDDWSIYEIPPGRYYLEAGYVDPDKSVLLKKWVNVNVGDNEVVEQVLRF